MKKTLIILIIGILIISIFNIFLPTKTITASAKTIYVDDSGGEGINYTNIQDAVTDADSGDTVYVYAGTYTENILIDRTITLSGSGSSITTISGDNERTIEITADNVILSGFTIENDNKNYIGIRLNHVTNCEIKNNKITQGSHGVLLSESNSNTITDNTIDSNNDGIYLSYDSDTNTIKNNNIQNNNGNGIFIQDSSDHNIIYLNHFSDNLANNARDLSGNNHWDYNFRGNYWDDYDDYDSDGDGTGDNPYIISSDSQDDYPQGIFYDIPVAIIKKIDPNPAVYGETVYFSGDYTTENPIVNWEWKSNKDGIFGYSKNTQSSSLSVGTHTISFRIKDNENKWSDYDYANLIIESPSNPSNPNQKPTAQIVTISPASATYGTSIYFHGLGQDSDGTIKSYRWTSSIDGIISSESTFYKSDLSIGTHNIYFKVEDNDGEWSTEQTDTIEITQDPTSDNQPPVANPGGPYTGQVGTTITFDGSGSYDLDSDDTISSYSWDFGDGNTGSGKNPTHTYTTVQDYIVYLTVKDNHGNQNQRSTYVNISFQSNNNGENGEENGDDKDDNKGTPGFELFFVIIAICIIIFFKRRKKP